MLYRSIDDLKIQCLACARKCIILPNKCGFCGVRENIDCKLNLKVYGIFSAINIDPIEKKPFYHYYPSFKTLSLGTSGCNWACKFCINFSLSHRKKIEGIKLNPKELLNLLKEYNLNIISFTYNEPTIYIEYIEDFWKIAKKEDIKITLVTNGYFSEESLKIIKKIANAVVINIKGNNNKKALKELSNVDKAEYILENIKELLNTKIHVEITDLIIPKYGDKIEDFKKLVNFIYEINNETPFHILQFVPFYLLEHLNPNPRAYLIKLWEYAKKYLPYSYIGNIGDLQYSTTFCPNCNYPLIIRNGFYILDMKITRDNKCPNCGYKIKIIL